MSGPLATALIEALSDLLVTHDSDEAGCPVRHAQRGQTPYRGGPCPACGADERSVCAKEYRAAIDFVSNARAAIAAARSDAA